MLVESCISAVVSFSRERERVIALPRLFLAV
jgi:hypothetical protein